MYSEVLPEIQLRQSATDQSEIASETNSRPFLHRRGLRAAEDNSLERPDITPVQEKVPGESR